MNEGMTEKVPQQGCLLKKKEEGQEDMPRLKRKAETKKMNKQIESSAVRVRTRSVCRKHSKAEKGANSTSEPGQSTSIIQRV